MIGPDIPPHLLRNRPETKTSIDASKEHLNSDPQENAGANNYKLPDSSVNTLNAATSRPRVGPQLPPSFERLRQEPSGPERDELDDSGNEIIGPLPPSNRDLKVSALDSKLSEIVQRADPEKKNTENVKRGEWMTVLPENRLGGDTIKTITRQFKRSNVPEKDKASNLWTETPEERLERLKGNKPKPLNNDYQIYPSKRLREQENNISENIEAFNQLNRPKSLMEIHQESLSKKHNKKSSLKGPDHSANNRFDRDRDMSIKTLDPNKQLELLKKSGRLNDRFASGSHSKYD